MILEARDLAIGYPRRRIGDGLALRLEAGRVVALLGPNGGGKTTLLKTLIGLLPPLAGTVLVEGRPLAELGIAERARRIAYVPQVHGGTFGFSVFEVVLMGRTVHRSAFSRPGAADEAAAAAAIERLGIAHLRERPYTLVSGGERQLALIARALAQESRLIVLDEPTASLDFGNQGRVLREMRALAGSGLSVLFTTHDPNQALRHADEVVLIRDGQIIAAGAATQEINRASLRDLYGGDVEEVLSQTAKAYLPA